MDERPQAVQRDMFAGSLPPASPDVGSGSVTLGISMWLVAAVALVTGIVIGFASGYTAGERAAVILSAPAGSAPAEPRATTGAPQERSSASQSFTEGAVTEPVRVDPKPIVTAPEPAPVVPEPRAAVPASRARRAAAVEPVAAGSGSLQVLSRPAGAQVVVDGRVVGRTPLVIADVRSGAHDVQLDLTGFRRWTTSVEVTPGNRTRVAASLEQ